MWWKVLLRAAVALGLDKWAEKKAGELIRKALDKLTKKAEALANAVPTSATVNGLAAEVVAFKKYAGTGAPAK